MKPTATIEERVRVLRSKNAGPFVITLDVAFRDRDDFLEVKNRLCKEQFSRCYKISPSDVLNIGYLDGLLAIKVSFRRRIPAGHPGDGDCYGMNQEEPFRRLLEEMFVA